MTFILIRSIPGTGMAPVIIPLSPRQVRAMAGTGAGEPAVGSTTLRPQPPEEIRDISCR